MPISFYRRWFVVALAACGGFCSLLAQPGMNRFEGPKLEEIKETLRFIRLAETKRRLNFNDEKLLKLNEILDEYEEQRLTMVRTENQLRQQVNEGAEGEEATALLNRIIDLRRELMERELGLWNRVGEFLTPGETLQFVAFYHHFQREVRRRIADAQRMRSGDRKPPRPGRRQR